tara:strand:- start:32 stop:601 length:570 start_codon:yes stop_codon:yes gene_type:complete
MKINFEKQVNENIKTHLSLIKLSDEIDKAIKVISKKLQNGGKLLLCGNGGSAADAQHLAAEFLVRLRPNVNRRAIPAISLAQDTSTLTACGNDYSFEDIFSRTLQAIGTKKDVLICISTSGNSKNILKVLKEAKKKNIFTIGFLGNNGGKARKNCDIKLIVNSNITARIQECHIFLGHFILQRVEDLII